MSTVNRFLFSSTQSNQIDRNSGIDGFTLMQMAGNAIYKKTLKYFEDKITIQRVHIFCGSGNNAGDGYVIATLAMKAGLKASVTSISSINKLKGEALDAYNAFLKMGGQVDVMPENSSPDIANADLLVDALLGTGIKGEVSEEYAKTINLINHLHTPVMSVDIPSGLCADTGRIAGTAVKADLTVTVISLKCGLFTADGPEYCGHLEFARLNIPECVYKKVTPEAILLTSERFSKRLKQRKQNTNKGDYGSLLLVGGEKGMGGSILMAAETALVSGAGRVTVLTRKAHISPMLSRCPEVMAHAFEDTDLDTLLKEKTAVVFGPGAGRTEWSRTVLKKMLEINIPVLLDADALNLIAEEENIPLSKKKSPFVLTPHPGEAAKLLQTSVKEIQGNRFNAIRRLQKKLGGCIVLKGSGSLVFSGESIEVCDKGNSAMAVAGCGDILSGLAGSLLAQGYPPAFATSLAVWVHASAGDRMAKHLCGRVGMKATELIPEIRHLLNQMMENSDH